MDFLGVIAAIVAIIWWGVYIVRGSLIQGCLVFLVVAMCFGPLVFRLEVGSFAMTLDRVLLAGLAIAYVVKRRWGLADPKPIAWPDVAMLLLAIVSILSKMTHHFDLAADEKLAVWQLVAGLLMPMAVYWIVRQSPIDQRAVVTTHAVLAIVGVYLSVTALAEVTKQWWLVYPSYIADPQQGIHFGRARGPMLGSHTLGIYLTEGMLCLWMVRQRWGRIGMLLTIALLPLFLAAIYVTYTRCVWISVGLVVLVVLGLSLSHKWRTIFVASALAASLLVAVFQWDNLVHMERDSEGGGSKVSELSAKSRLSFLYVSWKMFRDAPLLGVGYGQFQQAAKPYLADRSTSLFLQDIRNEPNHNTFLAFLTEMGLVGFSLFMAMLIGWTIQAWRLWRNTQAPDWVRQQGLVMLGMLTIYLSQALFSDLRFSPDAQNVTFILAGLTAGLATKPAASPAPAAEHPSLSQRALLWK